MKKERKGRITEKRTNFVVKWVSIHARAVSIFGKKSDAVCVFFFLRISVWFCGFRAPIMPPSLSKTTGYLR